MDKKIKNLIVENKIGEALEYLKFKLNGTIYEDEIISLISENKILERDERRRLASFDQLNIRRNRINYSLLQILTLRKKENILPNDELMKKAYKLENSIEKNIIQRLSLLEQKIEELKKYSDITLLKNKYPNLLDELIRLFAETKNNDSNQHIKEEYVLKKGNIKEENLKKIEELIKQFFNSPQKFLDAYVKSQNLQSQKKRLEKEISSLKSNHLRLIGDLLSNRMVLKTTLQQITSHVGEIIEQSKNYDSNGYDFLGYNSDGFNIEGFNYEGEYLPFIELESSDFDSAIEDLSDIFLAEDVLDFGDTNILDLFDT